MKLSLALLALVAASDSSEPTEESTYQYSPQSYAQTAQVVAPICLGDCPLTARCQNKLTGECSAPSAFHEEETKYYEEKEIAETCPSDSLDTHHVRLHSRNVLWVGFALLFAPALYVWWITFHDPQYAALAVAFKTKFDFITPFHKIDLKIAHFIEFLVAVKKNRFISFAILFIASLAYLVMALGYGFTQKCDGRSFYYVRYIDWFLTTPLILNEILSRANVDDHEKFFVIFMDLIMIVAGLVASLVSGNSKWVFFAFAVLAFLPVVYFLFGLKRRLISTHPFFVTRFTTIVTITLFTWIQYPIVWILSHGTSTLSANGETIWYTVLDIISKAVIAHLMVTRSFIKNIKDDIKHASSLL